MTSYCGFILLFPTWLMILRFFFHIFIGHLYIFFGKISIQVPGSMHDTGCLGLVHWDDPEGWNGEGGGRRVQDGEHMYTCEDSF